MYWINGIPKTLLPITDRSIHFGDGFFTTARLLNGEIILLNWHIERLVEAGKRLLFYPFNTDILHREMLMAAKSRDKDGVIKVLITRGSSSRGYTFYNSYGKPQRIILTTTAPKQYSRWRQSGIRLIKSPICLARNPLLAGIKHNNRLEQVLIRAYLDRVGEDEALVLDTEGIVVGCCSANLFWRRGKAVFTPALNYAGIAGVMRRFVISLLPMIGYTLEEVRVSPEVLATADEVFITNSLLPIISVQGIETWNYNNQVLYTQLTSLC